MPLENLAKAATVGDQVGTEILKALAARRQSQAALARELGMSAMWVSDRITGRVQITVNDLARIASTLGVHIVDLLPRDQREVTVTSLEPSTAIHAVPAFGNRPRDGRPANRGGSHGPPKSPGRTRRVHASAP